MKIAVFDSQRVGIVEGESIYDVTEAVPYASAAWPPVFMNRLIAEWDKVEPAIRESRRKASPVPLKSIKLEAPNPCPVHLIAAPANYVKHTDEMINQRGSGIGKSMRQLGFFLKASASILRPEGTVILPKNSTRRFDHESELAVIIGKTCKDVPQEKALDMVFGYSCMIDMTMRLTDTSLEERVTRKSFDTFSPFGPWILTKDEAPDPQNFEICLKVNGEIRQKTNTSNMKVGVAEQISIISSVMTLHPGDVITTGSPEGVGPIRVGDTVDMRIETIGGFTVKVAEAKEVAPKVF